MTQKIIVFTDLDGTLLHHYKYTWDEAAPALSLLDEMNFPVIFTSSKTLAEISELKQQIKNRDPFIGENGAVAGIPYGYFKDNYEATSTGKYKKIHFAKSYPEITDLLSKIKQNYGFNFRGFHDMSIHDVMALTDLSESQASNAKSREASEPIVWKDNDARFQQLKVILKENDLLLTSGGRFHHVMGKVNKGHTINWMLQRFKESEPETEWISIGLGDSFNDREMLESVDFPVYVKNPAANEPDFSSIKNLLVTVCSGPEGWNNAVLKLVSEITNG